MMRRVMLKAASVAIAGLSGGKTRARAGFGPAPDDHIWTEDGPLEWGPRRILGPSYRDIQGRILMRQIDIRYVNGRLVANDAGHEILKPLPGVPGAEGEPRP